VNAACKHLWAGGSLVFFLAQNLICPKISINVTFTENNKA
jgi:hypothetical protein